MVRAKIYINGKLTGYCDNPEEFTKEMRDKRRNGQINGSKINRSSNGKPRA